MLKKTMLVVLFSLFMLCTVFADEDEYYIVKLKENEVSLFSADEDMEYVHDDLYSVPEEKAKELLADGEAEYIEPDPAVELYDNEYNDQYYSSQIYMKAMKIPELQAKYSGEVRIAVIDSGVNRNHPDLINANIETGYNYVDENTDTTDTVNHGTRVTSIIAATPNNSIGVAGIAPNCTIVPLVAMVKRTENGQTVNYCRVSHLIKAVYGAVDDYNCKVINMSLGTADYVKSFETAINHAASKGAIVIAAAGNDGSNDNASLVNYPAGFKNTISVGAVTSNFEMTSYSQRSEGIDVAAVYGYLNLPNNVDTYSSGVGTSFAAPIITGMTALVVSQYPSLTVTNIRELIKGAAADILESGPDFSGYGVLMGDEVINILNYKQDVYIQPYINGNTANIKLLNGNMKDNGILVKAYFDGDVFKSYTTELVYFDNDGMFYTTVEVPENETIKLFVWDSLEGQQPHSDVREILPG